jgi:tetraacyldisaccharide 4'-kinase
VGAGRALAQWLPRAWGHRGAVARLLWPLSKIFAALVRLRGLGHRSGWLRVERLPVPVVVVGNLVAGGAGKTPTTLAVVAQLRRRGHRPGIVSRGYGRAGEHLAEVQASSRPAEVGDEPLLLHRRAGVPVIVARDRVAAARELLRRHPDTTVIVADDGLQHRRLGRDVQIIVFDERGAGNGWLLPAGPLREPMPASVAPATLVLYNAPAPTTPLPGSLARRRLRGLLPWSLWHEGAVAEPGVPVALRGRRVLACAGIARPQRFFAQLRELGLEIEELPLADHASFDPLPWPGGTADVIVTEKDAVKLDAARLGTTRVWVAALDFEPDAAFLAALERLVPPPTDGNPPARAAGVPDLQGPAATPPPAAA